MFAVVRLLVCDLAPNGIGRGGTDGERGVTLLPGKLSIEIFLDPIRRVLLEISHDIGDTMHWAKTRENVQVIVHAADNLRNALHSADDTTQVRMKSRPPFGMDERPSFLRRENNMVVKTEEG